MSELRATLGAALGPRYQVGREVRPVGPCRMFVAREDDEGPEILVKVLPTDLSLAVDARRFAREIALLAARLGHANLVSPLGAGAAGRVVYHTRPFVEGTTLRARLGKHGELPLHLAVPIVRDVLAALAHAHAQGVAHGDVKPEQVLLAGGRALLADAGVLSAVIVSVGTAEDAVLARDAVSVPAYLAPERRIGQPQGDASADVFAVGVLTYEMLTGAVPAEAQDPLLGSRALPQPLIRFVLGCLAERPADRWANGEEALRELGALGGR